MKRHLFLKASLKILLSVLLLSYASPLFGIFSFAQTAYEISSNCVDKQGLKYALEAEGKTAAVTGFFMSYITKSEIIIPTCITKEGVEYEVVSISNGAFLQCENITSIVISEGIQTIEQNAFSCCTNLKSIVISDSVTAIGKAAFSSCTSLESITLSNNIVKLEENVFAGCTSLNDITLPEKLVSIESCAFMSCNSLHVITIPASVVSINEFAFAICNNLVEFSVNADSTSFSSDDSGVLYNKDKTTIVHYPAANTKEQFTMTDSVENIEQYAFSYCNNLKNITLSENLKSIGEGAFGLCVNMKSFSVPEENKYFSVDEHGVLFDKYKTELIQYPVYSDSVKYVVPEGVTIIGEYAFYSNTNLSMITLPDSLVEIGECAFYGCNNLLNINFPDSLIEIGTYALQDTAWLGEFEQGIVYAGKVAYSYVSYKGLPERELILEEGTKGIACSAFMNLNSFANVTIPKSVIHIGEDAFLSCGYLKNITVTEGNANYTSDENGVLYNSDKTALIKYPGGKIESEYSVPDGVICISEYAFFYCQKLNKVSLPESVTEIKDNAFSGCNNLSKVMIPESVTVFGEYIFHEDTYIYGAKNSAAEIYCTENGYKFVAYIENLIDEIDALDISALTAKSQKDVYKLKETYDDLSESDKKKISNAARLEEAVTRIEHILLFPKYEATFLEGKVSVFAMDGILPDKVIMDVLTAEPSKEQIEKALVQCGDETVFVKSMEIGFKDKDGNAITADSNYGAVTITYDVRDAVYPSGMLTAIYIDNNGNITELATELKDGYASFPATNAGFYALLEKGGETGNNMVYVIITAIIILIIIAVIVIIKSSKKKKSDPVVIITEKMEDHEYDILS